MNNYNIFGDEIHDWALNLLKNGYKYEAIILFLSTWDFAYFRYILTRFDIENFKKTIEKLEKEQLAFFNGKRFENIDLEDNAVIDNIKEIYESLCQFVKHVGATKVMYLLKPEVFIMWDTKIINHYRTYKTAGKIEKSPEGYVNFMKLMQELYRNGEFRLSIKENETVTRAIDKYNWETYTLPNKNRDGKILSKGTIEKKDI